MDVDNGYYMAGCDMLSDREKIISGGHGCYLITTLWPLNGRQTLPHHRLKQKKHWCGLVLGVICLVYYDESFLPALAATVGVPLKMDSNTLNVERGRSPRICVEIDLILTKVAIDPILKMDSNTLNVAAMGIIPNTMF